jgi:ribosomal protein S18 acetylase RimI-like enzyme
MRGFRVIAWVVRALTAMVWSEAAANEVYPVKKNQAISRARQSVARASSPRPVIRRATSVDLDAIVALEARSFAPVDVFPRRAWRRLLRDAEARGSALTLVVESPRTTHHAPRTILAAITGLLRANSRVLRIYSLAVDPAARGQGLGRHLVAAMLAAAPERCDTLSLEVRVSNGPAIRLYESAGLEFAALLSGYYPDGGDGLRYRASFDRVRMCLSGSSAAG